MGVLSVVVVVVSELVATKKHIAKMGKGYELTVLLVVHQEM